MAVGLPQGIGHVANDGHRVPERELHLSSESLAERLATEGIT
jgi:hypothetical protein